MVQNYSIRTQNPYGSINRLGVAQDGRVVYQVVSPDGQDAGKLSVARKDAGAFEKSYHDIMETAPKMEKFARTHSRPEDMERLQKKSRNIVLGSTVVGAVIPMMIVKKGGLFKKFLMATLGGVAGLMTGFGISVSTTTPEGSVKFAKATKTMSGLDIRQA